MNTFTDVLEDVQFTGRWTMSMGQFTGRWTMSMGSVSKTIDGVLIPMDRRNALLVAIRQEAVAAEQLRASRDDLNRITSDQERENKEMRLALGDALGKLAARDAPIPMRLTCPSCKALHVDEGKFATHPHHSHACQTCGNVWRPAIVNTVGVRFLPGFKNHAEDGGVA